ncbi:MAG: TonB-dependent receptor, partial [Bacteroidetes bacterium]
LVTFDPFKKENQRHSRLEYTLNGFLSDASTGEELIGGTIYITPLNQGCYTNAYGFFSITLPEGDYRIEATYVGYKKEVLELSLTENKNLKIELKPSDLALKEVVVIGEKDDEGIVLGDAGSSRIDLRDLNDLPGLLGEKDLFGTLRLLPGIQGSGEGNGGFSVRGGTSDQNLILLDEAPIYNPAHLMGIFSVFNPYAINDVRLLKSHIPADYRGRLSSVVDIHMKEGNEKEYKYTGSIGLLMARFTAEGPIWGDKGSFMIAGRRTYHDLWMRPLSGNDLRLYFYDLNLKTNYKINENNRLFFSVYLGDDVFRIEKDFRVVWGNKTATLRWNHLFNERLFANTTFIFSDFDFDSSTDLSGLVDIENPSTGLLMRTRVRDYHLKQTYNFYPRPEHVFRFGWNLIHHTFIPGKLLDELLEPTGGETSNRFAFESSFFAAHDMHLSENWLIKYGIHGSLFLVLGGNDHIYYYDQTGARTDSVYFATGEIIRKYAGIEPRLSITRKFSNRDNLTLTYAKTIQYLQLLPSAFINNPASTWFPSSHIIRPQTSHQVTLGYFRDSKDDQWEMSAEIFGKIRHHQIAYRDGARLELGSDIESQLIFGKSWSYGVEFMLKKRLGKWSGWTSWTLSRTKNQFEDLNEGEVFNSEYDRPLNISLVGLYDLSPKVTLSATWNYSTGKLVTVPAGKYQIDGQIIDYYHKRNNFRMSDFHRLDLAINWNGETKKGGKKSFSAALYNVYARKNPSFVYVQENDLIDVDTQNKAWEVSLLPFVVPAFNFLIEF